jgi:hypothetical protein
MSKIIEPISNPDEIRKQAEEVEKEKFTDYYIDQPAPDPLTWHAPTQQGKTVSDDDITSADAELAHQNDPLKDVE